VQSAALELAEHAGARDIQAGGDVVGAQAFSPESPNLFSAEAAIAKIDEQETALIRAWDAAGGPAPPPTPPAKLKEERRKAVDDLAAARRTLSTLQRNVEVTREPAERAAAQVHKLVSEVAPLIDAVLAEEAKKTLEHLVAARLEAAKIEGEARSILAVLVDRKAYRHAESIAVALKQMPFQEPPINTARYADLIARLTADADPTVQL
jgi:hypothetical protein